MRASAMMRTPNRYTIHCLSFQYSTMLSRELFKNEVSNVISPAWKSKESTSLPRDSLMLLVKASKIGDV